jgi:D-mannonate dehydratase
MATRKVPVTSVTPASKVKATSKAQQSRTRNFVIGVAVAATPIGRVVKTASTASKMAKTADARRKFNAATERRILDNQVKKSVKVLPRNSAPKSGLEGRGAKLTSAQQKERAQALRFDKQERNYERSMENQHQVYNSGKDNKFFTGKPGKANVKKTETIKKAASKKLPIKINSNSSSRANRTRSGNKAK